MKQVVHTLQQALEKEKARVKDLKEQVWSPGPERLELRQGYPDSCQYTAPGVHMPYRVVGLGVMTANHLKLLP